MFEYFGFLVGLILLLFIEMSWFLVYICSLVGIFFLVVGLNWCYLYDSVEVFCFGGDLMGYFFVFFSMWIVYLMILSGLVFMDSMFLVVIYLFMGVILLFFFMSLDWLVFYVFFEFVLIPTFVLILGWGYQPEKIGAGLYLIMYTIFCSMPFLFLVFWIIYLFGSGSVLLLFFYSGVLSCGFVGLLGFLAFMVSVPFYGLHLWLPSAHVEAPMSGSMILAGVLLSLGGYGMIRYMGVSWYYYLFCTNLFLGISLFGGFYLGIVCLRQVDLKSMIAYSSVVHMGLVVGGIFVGFGSGVVGSYVLMIGHGLCSSGLFYYVGVVYGWIGSRSVLLNKGLMVMFPSSILFWFLFVSCNMSFPPSLNLYGEIFLLGSVVSYWLGVSLVLFFVMLFSGIYCLYMYSWVQHGLGGDGLIGGSGVRLVDFLGFFLHWVPLNLFFLSGDLFYYFI